MSVRLTTNENGELLIIKISKYDYLTSQCVYPLLLITVNMIILPASAYIPLLQSCCLLLVKSPPIV